MQSHSAWVKEISILEGPYIDVGGKKGYVRIEKSKDCNFPPYMKPTRHHFVRKRLQVNL